MKFRFKRLVEIFRPDRETVLDDDDQHTTDSDTDVQKQLEYLDHQLCPFIDGYRPVKKNRRGGLCERDECDRKVLKKNLKFYVVSQQLVDMELLKM